jgi:hypothetical protein
MDGNGVSQDLRESIDFLLWVRSTASPLLFGGLFFIPGLHSSNYDSHFGCFCSDEFEWISVLVATMSAFDKGASNCHVHRTSTLRPMLQGFRSGGIEVERKLQPNPALVHATQTVEVRPLEAISIGRPDRNFLHVVALWIIEQFAEVRSQGTIFLPYTTTRKTTQACDCQKPPMK